MSSSVYIKDADEKIAKASVSRDEFKTLTEILDDLSDVEITTGHVPNEYEKKILVKLKGKFNLFKNRIEQNLSETDRLLGKKGGRSRRSRRTRRNTRRH